MLAALRGRATHGKSKTPEYAMWQNARRRAREENLPFTLKLEDIHVPELCPVFGCVMQRGKKLAQENSPSLDRVDPEKGYVPGNVWVICWRANRIKNNATIPELERLLTMWKILLDMRKLKPMHLPGYMKQVFDFLAKDNPAVAQ